jgi:hypothetical protein
MNLISTEFHRTANETLNHTPGKAGVPITDNNFNMGSTWKVARRPSQSRNVQAETKPKPKKQPKTQKTTAESRNFHQTKSRNLKKHQKTQTTKTQENAFPSSC